ncbi:transposable element Tcb1 transposase [Trichonephila clavipes]|nr:transposable element Tcb1 transposase [Trichonephila clavipes]
MKFALRSRRRPRLLRCGILLRSAKGLCLRFRKIVVDSRGRPALFSSPHHHRPNGNKTAKHRSRRKQRSAFDQVSKFDRGRIVVYRDYGLSFSEFGSRGGRKQTTVMRICDRWKQEGPTDRRG